jgi:hypothetical protein
MSRDTSVSQVTGHELDRRASIQVRGNDILFAIVNSFMANQADTAVSLLGGKYGGAWRWPLIPI